MKIKENMLIGMIHLPALPGYESHPGMDEVINKALFDLKSLQEGGVDAVLVENEGDKPHQVEVGPEIISSMTLVMKRIVRESKIFVGVEVLLNDPKASLAIAKNTGADFIRTDYFVDKMTRKEYGGEMKINPKELLDYRNKIGGDKIKIFTDIQVKHATMLETNKSISKSAREAIREGSDGLIITGNFTGEEPELINLIEVNNVVGSFPVLVGSGFSKDNANTLLRHVGGAIVGTSIKDGNKVSKSKVIDLTKVVRNINSC